MVELPELEFEIAFPLGRRRRRLIEQHGFTGGHLAWHESLERLRAAAKSPGDGHSNSQPDTRGLTSDPDWRAQQRAAWKARETDTTVIDSIGISESIRLASEIFEMEVQKYFSLWTEGGEVDSDVFAGWAGALSSKVVEHVAVLWETNEWHKGWFARACRDKVNDSLASLVKEWQARAFEIEVNYLVPGLDAGSDSNPSQVLPSATEVAATSSKQSASEPPRPQRVRQRDPDLQNLKARVRKLHRDGLTHRQICDRLANSPRPPRASWRELEWPLAYKRRSSAVTKWLSDACR